MLTTVLLVIVAGLLFTVWVLSVVVRDRGKEIDDLLTRKEARREREWTEERRADALADQCLHLAEADVPLRKGVGCRLWWLI